jgi:hypothetical protein
LRVSAFPQATGFQLRGDWPGRKKNGQGEKKAKALFFALSLLAGIAIIFSQSLWSFQKTKKW